MKKQSKVKLHGTAPASDFIALGSKIADDPRSSARTTQCLSSNVDWRVKHLRKRPNSLSEGNIDPLTFHDSLNLILNKNDLKELETLILNAIEYIRCSKPCSFDTYIAFELGYFAKLKPSLFQNEMIVETLCSALRAASALPFTYKQKTVTNLPMIIIGILSNAFFSVRDWPLSLLRCYLEDATSDRLWVDQPDCSWFVENIIRAFGTKKASMKVDLDNLPEEISDSLEFPQHSTKNKSVVGSSEQSRFSLYRASEINKLVVGVISAQLNRRPDSRHIMKTLCGCCGLKEVRELAVSKLENWLHNPKFFKHGLELLLSIFANCAIDDELIFQEMCRMRIRTKCSLNYYLFGMKELVRLHGDTVLRSLLNNAVYTEISSSRTGISFNLMSALFSLCTEESSRFFASIIHALLAKDVCLKNIRLFIREFHRHVKHDFNFTSFCMSFFTADHEYFLKLLTELDINGCETFISSVIDIFAMIVFLCINNPIRDYFLTKASTHAECWENFVRSVSEAQTVCVRFLQITVPSIYIAKSENKTNPETQLHCLKEYVPCLYKSLFMEHPERYYKIDDWPMDTERGLYFRIVSEIIPSEEILYRVLQIGCDCNLPLIPLNALELEEQLLRRIASAYSSSCSIMSPQNCGLFFELLNKIVLYNAPSTIVLDKFDLSRYAFGTLFWKSALVIFLFVCFGSSTEFSMLVWTKLSTVRMLIEMVLTNDYVYPPQCILREPFNSEESFLLNESNLVEEEKAEIHDLESALCFSDNSYQLSNTLIKIDNDFPRRPTQEFLDKLKALNNLYKLAQRLCKSRQPDFLLDIIESHVSNETLMWLPQLIQSSVHCLSALPVRCLCEFLFNSRRSNSPNIETILAVLNYLNKNYFNGDLRNNSKRDMILEFFTGRCTSPMYAFRDASWDCLFSLIYPTAEQVEIDLGVAVERLFAAVSSEQILLNICKSLRVDFDIKRIYNVLLAFSSMYANLVQKRAFQQCFIKTVSYIILQRRKILDAMFSLSVEQTQVLIFNLLKIYYHALNCSDLFEISDDGFIVLHASDDIVFYGGNDVIKAAALLLLHTPSFFVQSKERTFLASVLLVKYPTYPDGSSIYNDKEFYKECLACGFFMDDVAHIDLTLDDLDSILMRSKLSNEKFLPLLRLLEQKLSACNPTELSKCCGKIKVALQVRGYSGCSEALKLCDKFFPTSLGEKGGVKTVYKFESENLECSSSQLPCEVNLEPKVTLQKILDKRISIKERRNLLLSFLYSENSEKKALFKELIAMIRSSEGKSFVSRMNEDVSFSLSILRFIRICRGNDSVLMPEEQELLKLLKYYETFGKSAFTVKLRMIVASTEKLQIKPKRSQNQNCSLSSKDILPVLLRDPRELEMLFNKMIYNIAIIDKIKCCEESVVNSENILTESVVGMLLDEILLNFDCVMKLHDCDLMFLFRRNISDNVKNILCSYILRSLNWGDIKHVLKSILSIYKPEEFSSKTVVDFVIGFLDHPSLNPLGFEKVFQRVETEVLALKESEIKNLIFYIFNDISELENPFLPTSSDYVITKSRILLLKYLLLHFEAETLSSLVLFVRSHTLTDSQLVLVWKLYLLDPNKLSDFMDEVQSNYDIYRFATLGKLNKSLFALFNSIIDFPPTKKAELHLFEVSLVLRNFAVSHPFLFLAHLSTLNILLQGKSSGYSQPEFKYKRFHLIFGYVMHLIQLLVPFVLKTQFYDVLESILDKCFEVSVLYFVNDLNYMTYKFLSLLEKYASFDSERAVNYIKAHADTIASFPQLNQFDSLKLFVNTIRLVGTKQPLCGKTDHTVDEISNSVIHHATYNKLLCGDFKEFQGYKSKIQTKNDLAEIIDALNELDKMSKIKPIVIDAFVPDLCSLMRHPNVEVRTLAYSLILKRITFNPSCYKMFYSSYLICLCSDNIGVVQTALKDFTEFFIFARDRIPELLDEAFRAGLKHRIDVSQYIANALALLRIERRASF